ncbi:MAG: hypothetical protein O7G31_14375, partial [Calditrichaeota bacterium]|nr:hypothetical protein [Calditrichota bacterium]
NTVQFGAKLDLYAASGRFNIIGFLAFDVLFQFNPFYFIAQISAMLALRAGSSSIACISFSLALEGPTPWIANGTAKLKLFWFLTVKVRFSKTFGEERTLILPDIEVLPLLEAALNASGNWQTQLPPRRHQSVSLKEIEQIGDDIIAHPFGILEVGQKVVPLNVRIDKFGEQKPADGNEFSIANVEIGTETQGASATKESFAPAQFFEKTDSEKLASPSFKKFDNGVRITGSEQLQGDYYSRREVQYELFYKDSQRDQLLTPRFEPLTPDAFSFNAWSTNGAIARSPLSFAQNSKSALAPDEVLVYQENYGIVNISDLTMFGDNSVANTEEEALQAMKTLVQDDPALEGVIDVVPEFEIQV